MKEAGHVEERSDYAEPPAKQRDEVEPASTAERCVAAKPFLIGVDARSRSQSTSFYTIPQIIVPVVLAVKSLSNRTM
jgi:hypothetical protein